MPHAKKLTTAALLGALLPFLLGADGSPVITGDESLAVLTLKLIVAALSPAFAVGAAVAMRAFGAGLVAWGRAKLADKDAGNDALGAAAVAGGGRLLAEKNPKESQ